MSRFPHARLFAAVALTGALAAACGAPPAAPAGPPGTSPGASPPPAAPPAAPAAPANPTDPGLRLCAEFATFPDNWPMPPTFRLSGFTFNNTSPTAWIVNQEGTEKGLRLQDQGAEIHPIAVVDRVEMSIGTFNSTMLVEAEDATGAVIASLTIPKTNDYRNYSLSAPGITAVTLKGGGGEASLKSICISIAGTPPTHG